MAHARERLEPAWTPSHERTAPIDQGGDALVPAPLIHFPGRGRGAAQSPIDRPTARLLGPAAVLGLQRTHGNAHVARLLVQRLPFLTLPGCGTAEDDAFTMTDEEKTRFKAIKQIMAASQTGREALATLGEHQVKIGFDATGGSVYDPNTNSILIDSNESDARAALALVHELHHARYEKEGRAANVMTLSREEYINKGVEEEAEGTVKSIEAKIELEGTTIDVSQTAYPFEAEYRAAYQHAVDAARLQDPAAAEDDLKQIGRAAGLARVVQGYMDGEFTGSRSGKTYPELLGEHWDEQHQQPGGN
jgi:hypothetical protein